MSDESDGEGLEELVDSFFSAVEDHEEASELLGLSTPTPPKRTLQGEQEITISNSLASDILETLYEHDEDIAVNFLGCLIGADARRGRTVSSSNLSGWGTRSNFDDK